MSDQLLEVILDEVRGLRTKFDMSAERLARLETHVEAMVGNHQPGRLTIVENKVADLLHWRWKTTGIYVGISGLVSVLTAFVYHLWK